MDEEDLSDEFLDRLESVSGKRSNIVVDHILEHGWISTRDLQEEYGYDHAPRAARDVREQGIPLETFYPDEYDDRVGAYRFDPSAIGKDIHKGRKNIPKEFKSRLVDELGNRCAICLQEFEANYLQVDHRIPYEVGGDTGGVRDTEDYMLVCASCNRKKSWQCEHCENWNDVKSDDICTGCYWASPESYSHVAMTEERRVELAWTGDDVELFEKIQQKADDRDISVRTYIRNILADTAE